MRLLYDKPRKKPYVEVLIEFTSSIGLKIPEQVSDLIDDFVTSIDRCKAYLLTKDDGYDYNIDYGCTTLDHLNTLNIKQKNPKITRGDVILTCENRCRGDEIYFFDGDKIIDRCSVYKHGVFTKEFDCINEFSPSYWNNVFGENKHMIVNLHAYLQEILQNHKIITFNNTSKIIAEIMSPNGILLLCIDICDINDILHINRNHLWYTGKQGYSDLLTYLEKQTSIDQDYILST